MPQKQLHHMFQMLKNLARMNRTVYGRNAKKNLKKKILCYPFSLSLVCFTFGNPLPLSPHYWPHTSLISSILLLLFRSLSLSLSLSLLRSSSSSSLLALSDSFTLSLSTTSWWVVGRLFLLLFSGCGEF